MERGVDGLIDSGAGLFAVAAQCVDLIAELANPLLIAAGDRHRQGEFQLFKLVAAFGITTVLASR